jgi:hypothetical protein
MPDIMNIVVLGDSVSWGQGLLDVHKYASIIADHFGGSPGVNLQMKAHSGAVLSAAGTDGPVGRTGEVPEALPTIGAQVLSVLQPGQVDLVLLNGGINDVGIDRILSPLTRKSDLKRFTYAACYQGMKSLLSSVMKNFTKPGCRVVVSGYYPILSSSSQLSPTGELEPLRRLLAHYALSIPEQFNFGPIGDYIVSLSEQFWHDSDDALAQAVVEVGVTLELPGQLVFVPSGFGDSNSLFSEEPWLFGFGPDLRPEDEVRESRAMACALQYPELAQALQREVCDFASVGHPNVEGAAALARAILTAL